MLVLEIDLGNAPKGGVWLKVEFKCAMKMRGVEEGME